MAKHTTRPRNAPQPDRVLEQQIEHAHRDLLAAKDWNTRAAGWRRMLKLLESRLPEVVARLEAERMARVRQ